ncbi:nicotinate-nucleotide--dimethylbenzimidazole phosphoribosyltransferase [Oryzibacter oryziterrae]|uniref:nicotinate-nucleotide--dimethylbenzimidazole phosphoribosyltransferase n=1 Tax=Oryzibacter oryziterrae TaxID=2766474 RepID=UPI001F006975|nr:nicotinate-nucleotide--dimethylbenzimidazole phosphoribosyltransferase [Oryzibacter oryziterrae]
MSHARSGSPFDDFRALIAKMPPVDAEAVAAVRKRDAMLTKPAGSLGKLESYAEWLAAHQGKSKPVVERPMVCIFAANHGVAAKGVSAFPASVTHQMVANFSAGGAAINQMCKSFNFGLRVFELALDVPTPDITEQDAFDEAGCAATMAYGMEAAADGMDLMMIGEMGIGNTTVAAAIYHALYGGTAADWIGRGTGVDDAGLERKRAAVTAAVARLGDSPRDGLEVLRRVGGREIAAMVGAVVAARHQRIPVIADGYVATAAIAILHAIDPRAVEHVLIGHASVEGAHRDVIARMGKEPVVDFNLRLGEGTGAAIAGAIVRAAADTHNGMATFGEAGVDEKG